MITTNRFIRELSPIRQTGQQLRLHILWLLMIRVMLFTLLIAVTVVLQTKGRNVILPPSSVTMAFLSVVFIYSIGSAGLLQNKTRHLLRFGIIQLLSDTVFAALLVAGTGCSQSIFTPIFIFPVIAGGLHLQRIGALIAAASASLLYGAVLASEYLGYIPRFYAGTEYTPPKHYLDITNIYAVYGITFFFIGILSNILAGRLRNTEEVLSKTSVQFDRLNQLYKQVFDDISTGIITVDGRNRITSCNPAFTKITGYTAYNLVGHFFDSFFPAVMLTETDQSRQVSALKKKDTHLTRVRYTFAHLNLPPDPDLDDPEDTHCKVITMQDISLLEQMEQQVRDAEKMAAIGELSAAVAHDFRNPIAAISGSAQILNVHIEKQAGQQAVTSTDDSTNRHLAEIILREAERMEKTITDFLQFARPTRLTPEWFDLERLIQEIIEEANSGKQCRAICSCTITADIPTHLDCWADRQLLQIVLIHLLDNSCTASAQSGEPVVIRAREQEDRQGGVISIAAIDQGPGIAENIHKDVFTPFFSGREDCAGLGLAIVKQIVEQHNGTVSLPSLQGQGCIVEICLPLPAALDD